LDKLVYLSLGLAFILIFIGAKLIMLYLHEIFDSVPKIETSFSLIVISVILVISTIASLIKSKRDPSARAHAGKIRGDKKEREAK
jgi:tellurite resistance protein TerC